MIPGNHDSRNVGYVHFEELFGERNSVLRKDGVTVVAVDSTEPDLDHGQIGRGRYPWIEQEFAAPARLRDLRAAPPPAARARHGPRAQRRLRRRRRDRVPAALGCEPRPLRAQARSLCVAAREPVRREHRHGLDAPPAEGTRAPVTTSIEVSGSHVAVWRRYPFHGQERIIQFDLETLEYEKYTARIEDEVTAPADEGGRPDRRRARAGRRPAGAARAALRVGRARSWSAAPRSCGEGEGYGVPLRRRVRRRRGRRRSLRRAGARPGRAVRAGPRARSPPGSPTSAPTSASTRPSTRRSSVPSIAVIGTGKRVGKTAVSAHLARLLARERDVVVVTMGRGGPPEPEPIETPPDVDGARRALALRPPRRLRPSRDRRRRRRAHDRLQPGGRRARRARRSSRTSPQGARLAAERRPDVVVFDGSGTAIPPVAVDRRVLVVGPGHDLARAVRPLPPPHLRPRDRRRLRGGGRDPGDAPAPAARPARGTGRGLHRRARRDRTSRRRRRPRLDEPRRPRHARSASCATLEADTYLTELKGAAIDLVAEDALARGRRVVLAGNDVVGPGLDEALLALAPEAVTA